MNRKRAKKEAKKRKERSDEFYQQPEGAKKKDTIWKIIMPGLRRDEASSIQRDVADEIESMIDNTPEC